MCTPQFRKADFIHLKTLRRALKKIGARKLEHEPMIREEKGLREIGCFQKLNFDRMLVYYLNRKEKKRGLYCYMTLYLTLGYFIKGHEGIIYLLIIFVYNTKLSGIRNTF